MAIPTSSEISKVVSGYNSASDASDYADTIVLEMELVSEENYQMRWSNLYTGNFTPNAER